MSREPKPAGQGSKTNTKTNAKTDPNALGPAALYEFGLRHLGEGRPLDAQVCCLQALAIDAEHADTLHLMGLLSLQAGQHDHAVEWLTRAIRKDAKTDYLTTLGVTLKQMGRLEDALGVFDKAVQLKPDDAELWKHLGSVLLALDRPAEALLSYQHALRLDGGHWEAAYQSGLILHRMERLEDALVQLDRCVELRPDHVPAVQLRARVLRGLKRFEAYLADTMRAHALDPADPLTRNNLGDAFQSLGRYDEALEWFDKALDLRPDLAEVLFNKGLALIQLHRFDEAIAAYARLVAIDPAHARGKWQWAHLQLLKGNFEAGWSAREARWEVPDFSPDYPRFPQRQWLGQEPIDGKTLLLCADEGFGDTIQFARFVPMLAKRGARIILVVQDALQPLLSGTSGVSECLPFSAKKFPPFDLHCPIMSLPLALGATLKTIPPADYVPPLPAERVQAWRARLGPRTRLRVGLVWSGNPKQGDDRNRSMPLAKLTPLLGVDATFVSLQKDPRPDDKARLADLADVIDPSADLGDFVETAALVSCLDLVITVCTSVAHLAATLGCPTWVMLPYVGDWRWLTSRDDSPWYPSVRLFRQDVTRDYAVVVDRVRQELARMISAFEPGKE
jgi:tetratricopeptide (TPR) repeat protein